MYKMHNNMILNKINSMGGYFSSSIKIYQRFHSSGIHPSNASNGVYGVAENLKLLPPNKVDAECIGVALIHKEHRIMIEKKRE